MKEKTEEEEIKKKEKNLFNSISIKELIKELDLNLNSILILDIRPQSTYQQSHLKPSINFNLPTTLLKRPLYGADKIQSSLPSHEQRESFKRYQTALPNSNLPIDSNLRLKQILVLDNQTYSINSNHPLTLVLNKFFNIGFQGSLVWLHGGFQALLNTINDQSEWSKKFIDFNQLPQTNPSSSPDTSNTLRMSFSIPPLPLTASLPTPPAFQSSNEPPIPPPPSINYPTKSPNTPKSQRTNKRIQMNLGMLLPHTPLSESSPLQSNSNSLLNLNQQSHSIPSSSASKIALSPKPPPNPFFDNIRQLNERLSLSGSLEHLSPIDFPILANPTRDLPRLPHFLSRLIQDSPKGRAQRLAHEFHDLEMAEQLRLQDVMRWESSRAHSILPTRPNSSKNSLTFSSSQALKPDLQQSHQNHGPELSSHHPFSISAGVELGYKNRYKNIWPYEHARIRLRGAPGRRNESDYVNASMINFQSTGTPPGLDFSKVGLKKYIATQGPLTSTFEDFWSVVAEEDVGMIVMITRRHEAGREKCADYVRNGQYGETVVSVNHHPDQNHAIESDSDEERNQITGFFGFTEAHFINHDDQQINHDHSSARNNIEPIATSRQKGGILCKTIHLSRATRPDLPPRKIAHIQYRGWPDFDVPPAAEEVLELIERSHQASEKMVKLNDEAIDEYVNNCSSAKTLSEKAEARSEIEKIVGRGIGPVIVHCSAGVGRTGSFILLDVMVNVLKAQYFPASGNTTPTNTDLGSSDSDQLESHRLNKTPNQPSLSSSTSNRNAETPPFLTALPQFLNSQLCDCQTEIAPIWQKFPIMPVINEMREQRMSMVANYRQYVFLHEVLMTYMINELKIPITTTTPQSSGMIRAPEEEKSTSSFVLPALDPPANLHATELPPTPESVNKSNSEESL